MQKQIQVGTKVLLNATFYRPSIIGSFTPDSRFYFSKGTVVESLVNGGAAVKFDGYQHAVDYTPSEVARMIDEGRVLYSAPARDSAAAQAAAITEQGEAVGA